MAKSSKTFIRSNMQQKELEKIFGITIQREGNQTQTKEKEARHIKKKTNSGNSKKTNKEALEMLLTYVLLIIELNSLSLTALQKEKYAFIRINDLFCIHYQQGRTVFSMKFSNLEIID